MQTYTQGDLQVRSAVPIADIQKFDMRLTETTMQYVRLKAPSLRNTRRMLSYSPCLGHP